MRFTTALLALLLFSPILHAAGLDPEIPLQAVAVPLDGSQAARTSAAIPVAGKSILRLTYNYTRVAGTDWKLYCEVSDELAHTNWRNMDLPDATGIMTADGPVFTYASLVLSRNMHFRIGVGTYRWVRCYPTVASAGATDTFTSSYNSL